MYGLNTSYYVSLIFWSGKAFFELLPKLLGLALAILSNKVGVNTNSTFWYVLHDGKGDKSWNFAILHIIKEVFIRRYNWIFVKYFLFSYSINSNY